ncbi:MAG TPA: CoA transferase [Acidimicrobiales bacterium]|nr:CoA transferase [Acidimicrobiales bacterium]
MDAAKPLAGIRVLDFCWVLAGPLGTRILSNFGAEVIRVEPSVERMFPDILPDGQTDRNLGYFHNLVDPGKRSVTIDPTTPTGRGLLLELAAQCDVVTDNYRPGALAAMGYTYEDLRRANPAIVVLHMPGAGSKGPWAGRGTLGNMVVGASGISYLTGFPGRSPRGMGVAYPDFTSPYLLATVVLAALQRRRATGAGEELELNQLLATISLIGTEWMQYRHTGEASPPRANRDPNYCPHGVYPTAGEDEWCAIAVEGDHEWAAFCRAMGHPEVADDERFADHQRRKTNEDDLDELVRTWTAGADRWELADRLQAAGVAAAAVENLRDALEEDPNLARHYQQVVHPFAPDTPVTVHGEAIRVQGYERRALPAPEIGADNRYVVCELLGRDEAAYRTLVDDGTIRTVERNKDVLLA